MKNPGGDPGFLATFDLSETMWQYQVARQDTVRLSYYNLPVSCKARFKTAVKRAR